jgi:aspartate carbamoyltransferase regulatory subunit
VPEIVVGRLRCPELSCVTNSPREPIVTRFRVLPEYEMLQCEYCDSLLEFEKVPEYVKGR